MTDPWTKDCSTLAKDDQKEGVNRALSRRLIIAKPTVDIRLPLLSQTDLLAHEFFATFRPDLPQGKSLATLGSFIAEIPRRMGSNQACDLAAKCICLEHRFLLTGKKQSIAPSRVHYGEALVELQRCLDSPIQAFSPDTLCATILLTIYEVCQRAGYRQHELG